MKLEVPTHPVKAPLPGSSDEFELCDGSLSLPTAPAPGWATFEHLDIVSLDPVLQTQLILQMGRAPPFAEASDVLLDPPQLDFAKSHPRSPRRSNAQAERPAPAGPLEPVVGPLKAPRRIVYDSPHFFVGTASMRSASARWRLWSPAAPPPVCPRRTTARSYEGMISV